MTGVDAAPGVATADERPPHPRLGDYRVTDLSAAGGGAGWVALALADATGAVAYPTVGLFVALAALVLVPLGLGLLATPPANGGRPLPYRLAVAGQPPAALALVAALALPVGSLASVALVLPWLAVTGAAAAFGVGRLADRGVGPLPELALDAALLYVPVGAVALVLHRAGVTLRFSSVIVFLTAVHYHYAGFVLPVVTGLAGRRLAGDRESAGDGGATGTGGFDGSLAGRVAAAATVVIVVNLALIAVGITFSPLLEVLAVSLFTVAVAAFAVLVLREVVPALPTLPAALLGVAAASIVLTMALALAYGYSAFPRTGRLIAIGEMVRWHGTLNAFGFALPALLALRLRDR